MILLLCTALVRPHWGVLHPALDPQHKEDMDQLEQVQRRAPKMIRWLEHLSYEKRLRGLRLFSLKKRKPQGDLIVAQTIL